MYQVVDDMADSHVGRKMKLHDKMQGICIHKATILHQETFSVGCKKEIMCVITVIVSSQSQRPEVQGGAPFTKIVQFIL